MTPDQYCQEKAASSGSSFYNSFRFLPQQKRQAITALYAFCREVDDVVDECHDFQIARTKLAWWREEISQAFAGKPHHPVGQALLPAIRTYDLPMEQFFEIIDGMEMDLNSNRYADFKALQLYCYRVASVVGLLAAAIFGYSNRQTTKYAHDLGLAFQLTNIIRDVGEDARRNRIYLPLDELQQFGVSEADILQGRETEGFARLMAFQIDRAKQYYSQAMAELPAEDRKTQMPGLIMAAIYQTLLDEIEADGCHVLKQKTSLPPLRKLWIAWRTWLKS
ncbi:MAG: presqualene diphosphate synthase HpnD [Sulfurimicrobium sp.]|jgi:phytoene synthase|nr:presqualene diphosphate synthase HpnD [Sulfurimicrobium sp.]MDZ7654327.1 presqualene diphosphate synthase HpnD [Sulfurimicrobium sp.]